MLNDAEKVIEYKALINVKNEMIAKLEKRSKDWEQAKYDADDKIVDCKDVIKTLDKKIAELNTEIAMLNKDIDNKNNQLKSKAISINKLWEHIDCLENNPFRRIYNWVVSIVKYRIKLVKIGDNK